MQYILFGRSFRAASPLTPHSAALHVGLKSGVPEGLPAGFHAGRKNTDAGALFSFSDGLFR
ncbi:hypothetical protein Barb7_01278 [Bacteroidales bacterium Barb7]|nr:hypothetical protein Barb7_01278 [Bacteroidales bacterium Barb7]